MRRRGAACWAACRSPKVGQHGEFRQGLVVLLNAERGLSSFLFASDRQIW